MTPISSSSSSTTARATARASTSPRSPSATHASACCGTTMNRGFGPAVNQGLERGHRRRARRAQQRHDRAAGLALAARSRTSSAPRSGSSARRRTAAATRRRSTRPIARYGEMVQLAARRAARARGSRVRHRGGDALLRGDAARRLRARRPARRALRGRALRGRRLLRARARAGLPRRLRRGRLRPPLRRGLLRRARPDGPLRGALPGEQGALRGEVGRHVAAAPAPPERLVPRPRRSGSARSSTDELPPDATVLVVSNGDDELLQLGANRRGWHFPQMEDGDVRRPPPRRARPRRSPTSRRCASRGAEYILFPETAFWWLEFYGGLLEYLAPVRTSVRGIGEPVKVFRCTESNLLPVEMRMWNK